MRTRPRAAGCADRYVDEVGDVMRAPAWLNVGRANITEGWPDQQRYARWMPAHHERARRTPARIDDRPTWLISRAFARSSGLLARAFEERGQGLRGYHYRLLAALEQWGP